MVILFLAFKGISLLAQGICLPMQETQETVLIPGLERSLGERNENPLQYSYLENSIDRGPLRATVHGVTKSWT